MYDEVHEQAMMYDRDYARRFNKHKQEQARKRRHNAVEQQREQYESEEIDKEDLEDFRSCDGIENRGEY